MNKTDYCSYCKRVTPHIKFDSEGEMLCKRCGRIEKRPIKFKAKSNVKPYNIKPFVDGLWDFRS